MGRKGILPFLQMKKEGALTLGSVLCLSLQGCGGRTWHCRLYQEFIARALLKAGKGRKREKWSSEWLLSSAALTKHCSGCLFSPPSGKLLLLQQVRFLAKVQHCSNFPGGEGRERGGESRIEEELPCPRLPLDRSVTAKSKKKKCRGQASFLSRSGECSAPTSL